MRSRWRVAVGARRCSVRTARNRNLELLAQSVFQLVADILIFFQERARVFAALAHALTAVAKPRAALLDYPLIHAEIDQIAFARNALAIDDVELRLAERRRHFILH